MVTIFKDRIHGKVRKLTGIAWLDKISDLISNTKTCCSPDKELSSRCFVERSDIGLHQRIGLRNTDKVRSPGWRRDVCDTVNTPCPNTSIPSSINGKNSLFGSIRCARA